MADLAPVEAVGDDWPQFRCAEPRALNPQILGRLAARGVPVVALAELPRSLEDVYLSIVSDENERTWSAAGAVPAAGEPLPEPEEVQP